MNVFVASSWRNAFQPAVVAALREDGHRVYDFTDSEGFHWNEVDGAWTEWSIPEYIEGLNHPIAERGFSRDMTALRECDACVCVMPCGVSASLEAGWACGVGKLVIVYVPDLREPELMVKMAALTTSDLSAIRAKITNHVP